MDTSASIRVVKTLVYVNCLILQLVIHPAKEPPMFLKSTLYISYFENASSRALGVPHSRDARMRSMGRDRRNLRSSSCGAHLLPSEELHGKLLQLASIFTAGVHLEISQTLGILMWMWEYDCVERPFWRVERSRVGNAVPNTSEDSRLYEQVNAIEGEGFELYKETLEAIAAGALLDGSQDMSQEAEALRCLHRAFAHQLQGSNPNLAPRLSASGILDAHRCLMGSSKPDIARRLRREDEIAFTMTTLSLPHVFMWPSDVEGALHRLVDAELDELFARDCQDTLLKLFIVNTNVAYF
ncbi:hypothetical protein SELMODRAFT_417825 [Selaginella moellendorffii]|uniref:Uncharacterized protein n=1 Tax=Selaginella moellendorffii TaxID=88036 RepID=D8S3S0_SELML|nr:hypothetical protein SELMODRAFT_417825 [Selaginella moellendorffii]